MNENQEIENSSPQNCLLSNYNQLELEVDAFIAIAISNDVITCTTTCVRHFAFPFSIHYQFKLWMT